MVELLIYLLILAVVVIVAFYVIDLLGLPHPVPTIVKLIIALVVLLLILDRFLPALNVGGGHLLR